jgi:hypothetical protein
VGWSVIAYKLITTGECTIAGTDPIWKGGIGNFINAKTSTNGISCLDLTFNLNEFLGSAYYKENYQYHIDKLQENVVKKEEELNETTLKFHDVFNLIPQ